MSGNERYSTLQEFVREKKFEKLLALKGKVEIEYDWGKTEKAELKTQKKREKLHHLKKIEKEWENE